MHPDFPPAPRVCALGPEAYAGWRASRIGILTDGLERRLVFEVLGDVGTRRVLDVGCGDGELAVELWSHGAEVAAVDASAAMIEAAARRAQMSLSVTVPIIFPYSLAGMSPVSASHIRRAVSCSVADGGRTTTSFVITSLLRICVNRSLPDDPS